MVYKWSFGAYQSIVDANEAGKEMERIEKENGEVTAASVVDAARPKKSTLHNLFEWDDKVAGEKYRLHQAASVICCLVSASTDEEVENSKRRAYVNVEESKGVGTKGRFVSIKKALSDDDMRGIVLRDALREMLTFKEKYKNLHELAKVFEAIDYTQETLKFD